MNRIACVALAVVCACTLGHAQPASSTAPSGPTGGAATAAATATASAQIIPAPPPGTPAAWLWDDAKSAAWKQATARCRTLLGQLRPDTPLAAKHLPRIKDHVQLLLKADGFDWKTATAVEFLENLVEDAAAGREPHLRYAGKGLGFAYWSPTMRRIEATWVHVPASYDVAKEHQLFMYYKCGGSIHYKDGKAAGGYRPTAEMANQTQTDTFHAWSSLDIQIKGRMGGHIELEEFPAALARDFSVSPDRVFVTGYSDGGFTANFLAAHWPHLVAGVAPDCGNWQYANTENVGLLNLPHLAVDGWGDGGYNNLNFIRWLTMRNMGADASGVWGHHGHTYAPYEDAEEFQYIMDWARQHRRNLWPKRVQYATWSLTWPRAYWVAIDRFANYALAAQVDVEVKDGNRIEVAADNVAALRLALSDKLLDMAKPVSVIVNGKQAYAGPAAGGTGFQPVQAAAPGTGWKPVPTTDGAAGSELLVELGPPPPGKYVKSAAMPDEITAVTINCSYNSKGFLALPGKRWLAVRPTNLDEKSAKLLEKWGGAGKSDADVTDQDIAQFNLLLYGGPRVNRLTARIAGELPVKFEPGRFSIGKRVFDQPDQAVAFLHPNPLNPKKYVIVYAFNDAEAFAKAGFHGMTGESVWKFRSGDCVVNGLRPASRPWTISTWSGDELHLMFDGAWRADDSPPLGELTAPFDYHQILRLKAEAIRQAAGTEVGVIWSYSPGWNRWGADWDAGSVTLHDLATVDMLPEHIMTADVLGSQLRGAQFSSLWASRDEPGFEAKTCLAVGDIQPDKRYKVAMGAFGLPAYGVDTNKMPKLHKFATQEDFLSQPTTSIPMMNLRQLPTQVLEATGQYIRKHGKLAPRPVSNSLVEYLVNTPANDFGACDWLHYQLVGAGARPETLRLNIGLRRVDEPATAPRRDNAKAMYEVGATSDRARAGNAAYLPFEYTRLDKKLPVRVEVTREEFSVVPRGSTLGLTPVGAATQATGGSVAECSLLILKLTNSGDKDIAGMAILSRAYVGSFFQCTYPDETYGDKTWLGFRRVHGKDRAKPDAEDAGLLVNLAKTPRADIAVPGAGYNYGLIGLKYDFAIPAGQTRLVPLLLISTDRGQAQPAQTAQTQPQSAQTQPAQARQALSAVLEGIKAQLLTRLGVAPATAPATPSPAAPARAPATAPK